LCQISSETIKARNDYYKSQNAQQIRAVESQLMAEEDPRLRTIFRNVQSRTRFGPDARRDAGASAQLPTDVTK
jgi:hypothetical protein